MRSNKFGFYTKPETYKHLNVTTCKHAETYTQVCVCVCVCACTHTYICINALKDLFGPMPACVFVGVYAYTVKI